MKKYQKLEEQKTEVVTFKLTKKQDNKLRNEAWESKQTLSACVVSKLGL